MLYTIEATCEGCGKQFSYQRRKKPQKPAAFCPACSKERIKDQARKRHIAGIAKDTAIKKAVTSDYYCRSRADGCAGCTFEGKGKKCLIGNPREKWGLIQKEQTGT